jgi:hypothetical protein
MLIDIALLGLVFFLSIPLVCAYYAYTHGRSFWLWFFIALPLPIVSHLLLLLLPDKTNPAEAELDELRVDNSLLGTKAELPTDPQLRKLAATQRDRIQFAAAPSAWGSHQVLEVQVNGQPLVQLLRQAGHLPYGTHFEGLPLHDVLYPSAHFLGRPLHLYWGDREGRTALAIHRLGGELAKAVMARVEVTPSQIFLHDFACCEGTSTLHLPQFGPFVFSRFEYVENLDKVTKPVSERR